MNSKTIENAKTEAIENEKNNSQLSTFNYQLKVPKLRFKEFSGEWVEKKLGEIGTFKNGINKSKDDFGTGVPFVNLMDVFGKCYLTNVDFDLVNANTQEIANYNLLKGDVLFIRSSVKPSGVGLTAVILNELENTVYSGFLIRFRDNKNPINDSYKKYCFYNTNFRNKIIRKSTSSANTNINQESLVTLKLNLPTLPEQQKIADCLSTWDESIENLKLLIEAKKLHKKGMMQKLFSQELRFKADDGSDYPDWVETSLSNVFKERKQMSEKSKGYEHISLTTNGVVPKSERYERDFLVTDDSTKKYKITKINDICYNPANLKFGVISRNKYSDGIFSPIYVTFEVINADIEFIEYLVTRWDFINKVRKYEEGTVYERQAVKPEDFLKFSIFIPSIQEQTKIANFLSTLDDEIELLEQELEQLQLQKKGLMQGMFV